MTHLAFNILMAHYIMSTVITIVKLINFGKLQQKNCNIIVTVHGL